jgi:hypothetical protein
VVLLRFRFLTPILKVRKLPLYFVVMSSFLALVLAHALLSCRFHCNVKKKCNISWLADHVTAMHPIIQENKARGGLKSVGSKPATLMCLIPKTTSLCKRAATLIPFPYRLTGTLQNVSLLLR